MHLNEFGCVRMQSDAFSVRSEAFGHFRFVLEFSDFFGRFRVFLIVFGPGGLTIIDVLRVWGLL